MPKAFPCSWLLSEIPQGNVPLALPTLGVLCFSSSSAVCLPKGSLMLLHLMSSPTVVPTCRQQEEAARA